VYIYEISGAKSPGLKHSSSFSIAFIGYTFRVFKYPSPFPLLLLVGLIALEFTVPLWEFLEPAFPKNPPLLERGWLFQTYPIPLIWLHWLIALSWTLE